MAGKDTGIVNIHGKEYKTVASRVQAFREKVGDKYSIITEIVTANDDVVVMKASVIKNWSVQEETQIEPRVIATGYAEEVRSSSQINRTSALENAETSAIGRALAAFGMAGSEYASADEVAQAIHQQGQQKPATASSSDAPSAKQLDLIKGLSDRLGIDGAISDQRIALISTKKEASEAIDKLNAAIEKKEAQL